MRDYHLKQTLALIFVCGLSLLVVGCGGSAAGGSITATTASPTTTNVPPSATSAPATSTALPPTATNEPTDNAPASVTPADNGKTITLQVGQRFLLNLGSEDNWDVQIADQSIVSRVVNITVIRGAQGVYEAHAVGETKLTATDMSSGQAAQPFEIQIVVQAAGAAAPPTTEPTTSPTTSSSAPIPYIDDRSDAAALITSLYNAINQHQYARAYSYWEDSPQRLSFDQFQAGYQDTAHVQVTLGAISGDAGAGQLYWSVPVTLVSTTTTGATQTFAGCYVLHLGQPAIQGTLPFQPLGIQSANIQAANDQADAANRMAHACDETGQSGSPLPPSPVFDPNDISAQRYIDNRSDAVALLRSTFNAINRREYVRAYSYWQSAAPNLPSLDQFTQGYSTTQVVTATFGSVTSDAGAGQFYSQVPVTLRAQLEDGTTQTFVGCYVLHLSNPDIQAAPPFQPLAIDSAHVEEVANDADTNTLLSEVCVVR